MSYFGERLIKFFLIFVFSLKLLYANVLTPDLPKDGVISAPNEKFVDPNLDYSKFMGRVTDKDDSGRVLKIGVENNNTKFLKSGDILYFKVNNHESKSYCKASVRSSEDFFFSVYVQDFAACWPKNRYLPRGLMLNFKSNKMEQRVYEASNYRELLIKRKQGFLNQLNDINHFLWSFDQQKLKAATDYDKKINELIRQKQLAIDNLINKKQESIVLQAELKKKLNSIDESLNHYRVERQEHITDRWNMDNDRGLPFVRRPQKVKSK